MGMTARNADKDADTASLGFGNPIVEMTASNKAPGCYLYWPAATPTRRSTLRQPRGNSAPRSARSP